MFRSHVFVFFSLQPRQSIQCTCGISTDEIFSFARQQQNAQHRHVLSVATGSSTRSWYCSVRTPPLGILFTACTFMWILCHSWHAFTCGTDFVHDMSPCGTGFVHDTCRHVVLCTVHSMHVHVEFGTVRGHVVQVLFMTRVAMWHFALFTPCTFMWNLALSAGMWYRFCS